ncbi:unnamed protein product [Lepeophtheirus salmonis]|uniref:(salmon louse) hypothetical protein n=1 Tax=Lepeophtheirus salmonis TaxID=72036 RepID=A0A817FCR6_LEPSM|nr:unnamed protein product [Lepeophtheirus salmonis]
MWVQLITSDTPGNAYVQEIDAQLLVSNKVLKLVIEETCKIPPSPWSGEKEKESETRIITRPIEQDEKIRRVHQLTARKALKDELELIVKSEIPTGLNKVISHKVNGI